MNNLLKALGVAFCLFISTNVWAQTYPSRPIKLVLPYPPGGSADIMGRLLGNELEKRLGQPVVMENKAGAAGIIGTGSVARAEPDGYTLLLVDLSPLVMHPHTHKDVGYNTLTDFAPVTLIAKFPMAFVVHADIPVRTLPEFIALAKSKSEPMTYGSIGMGSPHHLLMERFKLATGVNLLHVPYNGGSHARRAVLAGEVQTIITGMGSFAAQIKDGKVRPLAVAAPSRVPAFPNVPTFAEEGVVLDAPPFWFGLLAPAKTSKSIVDRLNKEVAEILDLPDIKQKFENVEFETLSSTPEEFAKYIKQEYAAWAEDVKRAKLPLQ